MNTYDKHKRNVNLILLLYFLYALAVSWGIIQILYYRYYGLSFLEISIMFLIISAIILILEIPTGTYADINGRKKSIIIFGILNVFSMIFFTIGDNFWYFLIACILFGIGAPFYSGAGDAMLFESLKRTKKVKLFEKILAKGHVFYIIGALIGVITIPLLYEINIKLPVITNLIFAVLIAIIVFFLYEKEIKKKDTEFHIIDQYKKTLFKSIIEFQKKPYLAWLLIFTGIMGILQGIFSELLVQPIVFTIYDMAKYSLIFTLGTLLQIIIVHYIPKILEKTNKIKYIIILLSLSLGLISISLTNNIFLIAICIGILFSVGSLNAIVYQTEVNTKVKSNKVRATVLSTFSMFTSIIMIFTFPIIGYLLDNLEIGTITQIIGFTSLILGGLILIFKKKN